MELELSFIPARGNGQLQGKDRLNCVFQLIPNRANGNTKNDAPVSSLFDDKLIKPGFAQSQENDSGRFFWIDNFKLLTKLSIDYSLYVRDDTKVLEGETAKYITVAHRSSHLQYSVRHRSSVEWPSGKLYPKLKVTVKYISFFAWP